MPGQGETGPFARPVVYCIIPRDLAPQLHDTLRRHFRDDASVEVIVEQRKAHRRDERDRRTSRASVPATERRLIRSRSGRRIGERRASLVSLEPPRLPRKARAYAERILFVERHEPLGQQAEDVDTARVVMRIQAGDRDAFALLYTRYFGRVYSWLRVLFKDAHEAENATQDVFIQVLEALPGYELRPGWPFRAWLFTVARNHAMTQLRRLQRMAPVEPGAIENSREHLVDHDPPQIDVLSWISDPELLMFVERLPIAQRQVLVLRYMLDLSDAHIAELLDCSSAEVRMLRSRGLRFLRQRLDAVRCGRSRTALGAPWRRRRREAPVLRSRRFALKP